jgi:hypothetical protein
MKFLELPFADPDPWIIRMLRIIQHRTDTSGTEPAWVATYLESILRDWERGENLDQLKTDLGLTYARKRRTARTVRRESELAIACVEQALAGSKNPIKDVAAQMKEEVRQVQRAWKTWREFYLGNLESYLALDPSIELERPRAEIRAAIKQLSRHDKKS